MHSRDLIEQYKGYVQDWRRYFHKHPELSNEEFETTKTLAKELESMGVEVHVDTERGIGLVGIIHGDKPVKPLLCALILMHCLFTNIIQWTINQTLKAKCTPVVTMVIWLSC